MIPITCRATKRNTVRDLRSERPNRQQSRRIATRIQTHTTSADRSRTLAQELAQRPGGLLAAKIHLKHVSATTEGYANRPGGSQALFHAEVQELEEEHHLRLTIDAFHQFQAGQFPAGPGARGPAFRVIRVV
jgi:hypothetical protein